MTARRRRLIWGFAASAVLVAAAGVLVAIRYGRALTLTLALAIPAAEPWLGAAAEPVSLESIAIETGGPALAADVYHPPAPRGGLLLVHGLSPAGRRHPELVRVATLLAERGQLVLVPHFPGLAAFRLSGREVDEVRAGLAALRARAGPIGAAGFSFGAGPLLVAAAGEPDLRATACFGGYADLRHVIAYVTTGAHAYGGERYLARQEEYNRWKLLALLEGFVQAPDDRARLAALARVRLADPGADTRALAASLGPEGRAMLALAENREEHAVDPLIAALPAGARAALDVLSPARAVPRIAGRLLVAHGADDPSIPFTESLRLAALAGSSRVVILRGFHHTGPGGPAAPARLLDAARLVPLLDELLAGGAT